MSAPPPPHQAGAGAPPPPGNLYQQNPQAPYYAQSGPPTTNGAAMNYQGPPPPQQQQQQQQQQQHQQQYTNGSAPPPPMSSTHHQQTTASPPPPPTNAISASPYAQYQQPPPPTGGAPLQPPPTGTQYSQPPQQQHQQQGPPQPQYIGGQPQYQPPPPPQHQQQQQQHPTAAANSTVAPPPPTSFQQQQQQQHSTPPPPPSSSTAPPPPQYNYQQQPQPQQHQQHQQQQLQYQQPQYQSQPPPQNQMHPYGTAGSSTYPSASNPAPLASGPRHGEDPNVYHIASTAHPDVPRRDPSVFHIDTTAPVPRPNSSQGMASADEIEPCPPRYFRTTLNAFPESQSLLSKSKLPLGVIIHPLNDPDPDYDDEPVPVVSFGHSGIVRCRRCRTYINPYVVFIDGGRRWRCNLCFLPNDVPSDYFAPVDSRGLRTDRKDRPELINSSVEFIAPAEYMVRPPQPPVYFFLIDVSHQSVASGMLKTAIATIQRTFARQQHLLDNERIQIGFITYDSTVHYYALREDADRPQRIVIADTANMFIPSPDDLLVNLDSARDILDELYSSLPDIFTGTTCSESALGAALNAAYKILTNIGGKIIVLQSTLPNSGPAKLKNRLDPRLSTSSQALLTPAESFYKNFAVDCSRQQISVDVFAFSPQYQDLATLSMLPKHTGGQLYHYIGFSESTHGDKLKYDLKRNLSRIQGWEAVLRLRVSKGWRVTAFHGNFFVRSSDLLALPAVDQDKSFAIKLTMEDSSVSQPNVYMQSALLYTSAEGSRRIRIHTHCIPIVNNHKDLFRSINVDAMSNFMIRTAAETQLTNGIEAARNGLVNKLVDMFAAFRKEATTLPKGVNSMVVPASAATLPQAINGALKNIAFRQGRDVTIDERIAFISYIKIMPVAVSTAFLVPNMYRITDIPEQYAWPDDDDAIIMPPSIPPAREELNPSHAYLLEDGFSIWIWIGRDVPSSWIIDVFSMDSIANVPANKLRIMRYKNDTSRRIDNMLAEIQDARPTHMSIRIVKQGEQGVEEGFFTFLVEDRSYHSASYRDFLGHIHKQVLNKL